MNHDDIEYRTTDIECPRCKHAARGIPIPKGSVLMMVCGKCGVRFEYAEATAHRRLHDYDEIIKANRTVQPSGYEPSSSHADASAFRQRQAERVRRVKA